MTNALHFNVEAYAESLSLLRPFFPHDWFASVKDPSNVDLGVVASAASYAFSGLGEFRSSAELDKVAMRMSMNARAWSDVYVGLYNLSVDFYDVNRLALSERYSALVLGLAETLSGENSRAILRLAGTLGNPVYLFCARLRRFEILSVTGRWDAAEEMWNLLDPMGRQWPRGIYRQGDAELAYLHLFQFPRGRLSEKNLSAAERLARAGYNRGAIRTLHRLRGEWQLARGEHALAAESLQEAIRMAHEAGFPDPESEAMLALSRFHLKQLPGASEEALRLSTGRDPAHLQLAELWLALADTGQATIHAKAAYGRAWADGEPYVRKHDLDRAKTLLKHLGTGIPELPAYDPALDQTEPWEDEIAAAISELGKPAHPET